MANTKFEVDLGELQLTDEQKRNINAAIQKAVTGELASLNVTHNVALIPIGGGGPKIKLPILQGIIARPLKPGWAKEIGIME